TQCANGDTDYAKSPGDSAESSNEPIRVGDYHAESLLAELVAESPEDTASRPATQDAREPFKSSVTQLVGRMNNRSRCCAETIERHSARWAFDLSLKPRTWVVEHYQGRMRAGDTEAVALPKETQDALITTYISNLDALIPIFDGSLFLREYVLGSASPYMVKAICLTACKIKQAAPYLRLTEGGLVLTPRVFSKAIYKDLEVAVDLDLEPNRLHKIQILALMWLHHDDHCGIQKASARLSQAINEAFVLSLHFDNEDRPHHEQCKQLWWTLRAFDRQNPCLQGVPSIIMDRDVDVARPEWRDNSRSQAAIICLRLGDIMDDVMEIYRPRLQRRGVTVLQDFPTFAEVTGGTDLALLQESHRDYLEIWYLVLAMLSCRYSVPDTPPYKRRFQSAERVRQLNTNGRHSGLPPLPMIPYAVALSLTVTLRAAKDRPQEATMLKPAIASLQAILEEIGNWSPQASGMHRIAKKLITKLQISGAPVGTSSLHLSPETADESSAFDNDRDCSSMHARSGAIGHSGSGTLSALRNEADRTWKTHVSSVNPGQCMESDLNHEFQPLDNPNHSDFEALPFDVSIGFEDVMDGSHGLVAPGLFDFSSDYFP
ncbi:unnamed protein product, partial [Clonostachys rosea]